MTPVERITITEEVVKNGQLVTQERETLQYTADPVELRQRELARGLVHGNIVLPQDRIYEYDESTGMSVSRPRDSEVTTESETEAIPEEDEEEDSDAEDEDDEEEPEAELDTALCNHPVGVNGTCVLQAGHSGQHRLVK